MAGVYALRPCRQCGTPTRRRFGQCLDCRGARLMPGAVVHPTMRFELDDDAQAFVEAHPHGATLEEVGAAMGISRERVRQIEEGAVRKLKAAMAHMRRGTT